MVSVVLFLWGVGPILKNGMEIRDRNYVTLLQESEMSARLHSRNLILEINYRRITSITEFL